MPVGGSGYRYFSGGLESQCPELPAPASPYVHRVGWFGLGRRMDWYLAPTPAGGFDFTSALFELTGAPAVPPRFAMGFMATYWGYSSMAQVEGYMHEFRQRKLPIDSFIMDYDWFGPEPCGVPSDKHAQGGCNCGDYGYRRGWWDNVSFVQPDGNTTVHCATPADVLSHFKAPPLRMHFGAIRKPRTYSNLRLSQANGWLLPNASDVGEGGDVNWNFSVPSLRAWYAETHAHFVHDGIDFWWNDEGETSWDTYLRWNEAQAALQRATKPNTRHFTLNRAWQPGMQRFPAAAWTGDGQSCTHDELLRATLHGCPLISCDLTSPDATTLVRQYQSAVFTPLMRVHMMKGTPRFPWFWPKDASAPDYDAHQRAFRAALQLRYTFLPFLYSLAHAAHRTGRPMAHPASFSFPGECSRDEERCRLAEAAYMVGSVLAPADLGLAHTNVRPPPLENLSTAYLAPLPGGARWFRWNSTVALDGGQTVRETLALEEVALYVRGGAILPLHGGGDVQRAADMGGRLEVQVYSGADGEFVLSEDDGVSLDYQGGGGGAAVRSTTWRWDDAARTLSWSVAGGGLLAPGTPALYSEVVAALFTPGAAAPVRASVRALAKGGMVVF